MSKKTCRVHASDGTRAQEHRAQQHVVMPAIFAGLLPSDLGRFLMYAGFLVSCGDSLSAQLPTLSRYITAPSSHDAHCHVYECILEEITPSRVCHVQIHTCDGENRALTCMSSPSAKHTPGLRCAVCTNYAPTHYSSEGGACPARACHPLPEGMGAHARQTCESLTEYCGFRYLVMNAPTFAFWVRGAQCTLPTATHACGGTRRLSPPGCEVIEVIESVRVLCADMRCSVAAKPAVPDGVHSPCRGVLYRRHLHLLPVTHHTRWHAGQRRPHAHGLRLLQCTLYAHTQTW